MALSTVQQLANHELGCFNTRSTPSHRSRVEARQGPIAWKATVLNQSNLFRLNPDLRRFRDFLETKEILIKTTDVNLGIAVISKS